MKACFLTEVNILVGPRRNAICQATGLDFNAELKLVYQEAGRATSCSDRSWEEGPSHVTRREGGYF